MNIVEDYRQTAKGIWPHILPLIVERFGDVIRFFRATVVKNNGDGTLSVQRANGPVVTISCSGGLTSAAAGDEVMVLVIGKEPDLYMLAACGADPADFAETITDTSGGGGGGGGGVTQQELDEAIANQEEEWKSQYEMLYQLIMASSGEVLPVAQGHPVDTVTVYYYLSTSRTELVGGQWQLGMPEITTNHYLWTKLHISYTDAYPDTETDPVCITAPGIWTVLSVTQLFLVSAHGYELSLDELNPAMWRETVPALTDELKYVWTRQHIVYTEDGTTPVSEIYTEPYCLSAAIGEVADQKITEYTIDLGDGPMSIEQLLLSFKRGYIAQSEFGYYLQEILNQFKMDEEGMEQDFTFFSELKANLLALQSAFESYQIGVQAYIRTGIVDWTPAHVPIFGMAIGKNLQTQITVVNGESHTEVKAESFRALYTESGLSFWYNNDKVAYIDVSDGVGRLVITHVVAFSSLRVGNWLVRDDSTSGLTFKWIGG